MQTHAPRVRNDLNGRTHPSRFTPDPEPFPNAPDAERALLGAILLSDASKAGEVLEALSLEDFYKPGHRQVLEAMKMLLGGGKAIDSVTLSNQLRMDGDERAASTVAYLLSGVASAGNINSYLKIVKDHSVRRALIRASQSILEMASEGTRPPEILAGQLEEASRVAQAVSIAESNPYLAGSDDAVDLLEEEIESPPFLVDGLIHVGMNGEGGTITFLAGDPNIGKTYAALHMMAAVSQGTPWFGIPSRRGRCGGIFLETPQWQLQERLRAITGGNLERHGLFLKTASSLGMDSIDVCDPRQREQLTKYVQIRALDLLVIDPFAFLHSLDENKTNEAKQIGDGLKRIAREAECAIVVLDHYRKGTPGTGVEDVLQKIRGSIAKPAFSGTVMGLDKYHGNLRLRFGKVAARKLPEPIFLRRLDNGTLEVTEAPEDQQETRRKRMDALDTLLDDDQIWKLEAIQERLDTEGHKVSDKTLRKDLREMIDEDRAWQPKRGFYQRKPNGGSVDLPFPSQAA